MHGTHVPGGPPPSKPHLAGHLSHIGSLHKKELSASGPSQLYSQSCSPLWKRRRCQVLARTMDESECMLTLLSFSGESQCS
jgi:hypothetical protein